MSRKFVNKIDVLGVTYTIYIDNSKDNPRLENVDGYIIPEKKVICLDENNHPIHQKHVLRHELTHAFLFECGLDNCAWSANEEVVDWISIQAYKLNKLFKEGEKMLYRKETKE